MAFPQTATPLFQQGRQPVFPNIAARNKPLPIRRKMTKVILDETALISGMRKEVLKTWFSNASICIFVPLSTLERLNRLGRTSDRIGHNAREASKWLDEISDCNLDAYIYAAPPMLNGRNLYAPPVYLENTFEHFKTWGEAEKYLLPEPLLSIDHDEKDESPEEFVEGKLSDLFLDDVSDNDSGASRASRGRRSRTPTPPSSRPTSTGQGLPTPNSPRPRAPSPLTVHPPIGTGRPSHKKTDSIDSTASAAHERTAQDSSSVVPVTLRPFFNHILWRMHKDKSNHEGPGSFVLLTNDSIKISIARQFGISAKRIEEMADQIALEELDYKKQLAEQAPRHAAAFAETTVAAEQVAAQVTDPTLEEVAAPAIVDVESTRFVEAPAITAPAEKAAVVQMATVMDKDEPSENGDDSDGEVVLHRNLSPPVSLSPPTAPRTPRGPSTSPPTAPQAMQRAGSQNSRAQVLDPNSFARGSGHNSRSWRGRGGANRGSHPTWPRGRNQGLNARERNQPAPVNAVNAQRARIQVSPANSQRERNPPRSPRAPLYVARRGSASQQPPPTQAAPPDLSQPIDPEAYFTGRARGEKGKLWNPK